MLAAIGNKTINELAQLSVTASATRISVLPVNDQPRIDPVTDLELPGNSPGQTITLTGIGAGPANENNQQLILSVASDNVSMIPDARVVYHGNGTATLSFSPVQTPTFTDAAVLTVTVRDDGGTARGGVDTRQLIFLVRFTPPNNLAFMPNLFTPNGDSSNDRYTVMGEGVGQIILRVFDRKGVMV